MKAHAVRRAVILAGSVGAELLPATKAVPQEMLPLVDRPLVQYAVEEALDAGIEQILIVTGRGKGAIEDHFDCATELEDGLRRDGRHRPLAAIENSAVRPGVIAYIRQQQPLGLAHALWCARYAIGDEPFAVLVPDDVIQAKPSCLAQMAAAYRQTGGNLVAVAPLTRDCAPRHGVLAAARRDGCLLAVSRFAPQRMSADPALKWTAVGRFILDPGFVDRLGPSATAPGATELADGLAAAARDGALSGYAFAGQPFDCSNPLGLLDANIAFTLARSDLAPAARTLLARHVRRAGVTPVARPVETPGLAVSA